jgi:hypothetical protein
MLISLCRGGPTSRIAKGSPRKPKKPKKPKKHPRMGPRARQLPSATEAFHLVRDHMRLRRPGVRVEDELGNPVSFFQLKEMAELEAGNEKASLT